MSDSAEEHEVLIDNEDQEDFDETIDDDAGDDEEEEDIEKNSDDDESVDEDPTDLPDEEEDELMSVKSQNTEEDVASVTSRKTDGTLDVDDSTAPKTKTKAHKKVASGSAKRGQGRAPSVAGLTIPFRTVKKAMKLDPDIPIVQNEAAIMTTFAVELFLKRLAKESCRNAKNRGRNTVRYEDVAEARTSNHALAFLETLLP